MVRHLVAGRQGEGFTDLVALDECFTAGRRGVQAVRRDQRRMAVHERRRDGSSLCCHDTAQVSCSVCDVS